MRGFSERLDRIITLILDASVPTFQTFSWFRHNIMIIAHLVSMIIAYFRLIFIDTDSSVFSDMLIDMLLNLSTSCSRCLHRSLISDTCPPSFEFFHPFLIFPLDRAVLRHGNCEILVVAITINHLKHNSGFRGLLISCIEAVPTFWWTLQLPSSCCVYVEMYDTLNMSLRGREKPRNKN